jgi:2',3'-cyclic-nucleotide 2'-phosphodiesterase (5'-nucleotidase family)
MRTLFLSALLAALFLLVSAPSPAEAQNFQLNVLYTSDVRGRMLPIQLKFGSECTVAQAELNDTNAGNDCFGGVARRAKFIQDFRAANPNTIAVDIANVFFGTSIAAIAQPQASNIGKWMSDATYDVQGLGTNEFFK